MGMEFVTKFEMCLSTINIICTLKLIIVPISNHEWPSRATNDWWGQSLQSHINQMSYAQETMETYEQPDTTHQLLTTQLIQTLKHYLGNGRNLLNIKMIRMYETNSKLIGIPFVRYKSCHVQEYAIHRVQHELHSATS